MHNNEPENIDTYMQSIPDKGSNHIFIVTPGARDGIKHPLIQRVFSFLEEKKHGVVAFDFSYYLNDEEVSPEFKRELHDLHSVYRGISEVYPDRKVHLIGKSLGGIVSSRFVKEHGTQQVDSVTILGYVPGQVDFGEYDGKVSVIQGADDRFGNAEIVQADLEKFRVKASLSEIPCADHSFNCTKETGKMHVDEVVKQFSGSLENVLR